MPQFERSAATDTLVELLATCPEGETVTWAEMQRATNRDVTGADRYLVTSARRVAHHQHGAVFGTIIRVGLRRLWPAEHTKEGRRRVKLIGKAARRGKKVMQAADLRRMTKDEMLTHSAVAGVLQAIDHSTRSGPMRSVKRANSDPVAAIPATAR